MKFPQNFLWGVASSAYQTEGYPGADGGGPSIWDTFCAQQGKIADGSDGSVATDSYHRYQEDVALIAQMGLSVYRFSISWARVDPRGTGDWNEAGFQFYQKLIDCCLANHITPFVTLYHWELPQALEANGGWRSRETALAFGRYAGEVARRFSGVVTNFITLNEPQCTVFLGHGNGVHAPGLQLDLEGQFAVLHHQLLAHGFAVHAIREISPSAKIGIASTGRICYPKNPQNPISDDIVASEEATFQSPDNDWGFTHQMILDPICFGHYPQQAGEKLTRVFAQIDAEDLKIISAPVDFIGLNIYNGNEVFADQVGQSGQSGKTGRPVYAKRPRGHAVTALGWPVTPEVMEWGVRHMFNRYHLPIYITENGMSCHDSISLDGNIHDPNRIDFLERYLQSLARGMQAGADVRGYFHWSLCDNFEWNAGYGQRFGLVYVDYATGNRIPKDSAYWLREQVGN